MSFDKFSANCSSHPQGDLYAFTAIARLAVWDDMCRHWQATAL